jgi:hypothetical protein
MLEIDFDASGNVARSKYTHFKRGRPMLAEWFRLLRVFD